MNLKGFVKKKFIRFQLYLVIINITLKCLIKFFDSVNCFFLLKTSGFAQEFCRCKKAA